MILFRMSSFRINSEQNEALVWHSFCISKASYSLTNSKPFSSYFQHALFLLVLGQKDIVLVKNKKIQKQISKQMCLILDASTSWVCFLFLKPGRLWGLLFDPVWKWVQTVVRVCLPPHFHNNFILLSVDNSTQLTRCFDCASSDFWCGTHL